MLGLTLVIPGPTPAKMPSSITMSSDDKAKVKKAVPQSGSTNKIVTATVARVYQAEEGARRSVLSHPQLPLESSTGSVADWLSQLVLCWS